MLGESRSASTSILRNGRHGSFAAAARDVPELQFTSPRLSAKGPAGAFCGFLACWLGLDVETRELTLRGFLDDLFTDDVFAHCLRDGGQKTF